MSNKNLSLLEIFLNDSSFENWAKNTNQNDFVFWNNWIAENPDKIDIVYNARSIILGISFEKRSIGPEKINRELEAVLLHIKPDNQSSSITHFIGSRIQQYMTAAAVGILLIVIGIKSFNTSATVSHKTAYGEIIDLKLPDGTSVVLNGNSVISYDKDNSRDITLIGEAYFKVKSIPSTKAKFWVNTNDLKVEVFGTQFHVNTREKKTDVLLDEGSIKLLLNNGTTQNMVPGEMVSFSTQMNTFTHEKVTQQLSYSLWREGTYVFNNSTLDEVMKNVEHAYGVKSEFIDEALKHEVLTGGIPNQNLRICLSAIEKSTGTRIVQKDNRLLIFKN